MKMTGRVIIDIAFQLKSKRLQCYDRWKKFFRSTSKKCFKNMITFGKITGQSDDNSTERLLHYPYFEKYYKLIAIDLSK